MKKKLALSLILTASLINLNAQSSTNENPPVVANASGIIVGAIFLTVVTIGVYAVVKASSNIPSDTKPVTFVLEKSTDNSTWIPVCTNTIVLNGRTPIECFREKMTDGAVLYRAKILRK